MSPNPWGPNEPASVILAEETWLQGALISKIFYGILLVLSWQSFFLLLKRTNYKAKVPFLAIVFAVFMFGTFHTGFNMKNTLSSFIENRNYPGGPSAYENGSGADSLRNIAYSLIQWLCDALLVSAIDLSSV